MKRYSFFIILCFALSFTIQAQHQPLAKHVILIGLDGWSSYGFENSHDIPNILNLKEGGSYYMHKRSVIPSHCAINRASIFMGIGPEMHGYTQSQSQVPEVPSIITNENGIFPTIFSVIREQCPEAETGCTFDWIGIKYLIDTLSISYVKYFSAGAGNVEQSCDSIVRYIIEKKPVFLAPCFDGIDAAGHSSGWYTTAYYNYVARIDQCIGRIIQALIDAGIYDETIIIVTGDHGGHNKTHGTTDIRDMETPLIFFGKNVRPGYQIQEPVVQYDIAATVAYILGLETPSAWRGKPTIEIFNP
jgi:predicted AlkP superfamily pyrophosphatase or phosphodiesterase